MKNRFDFGLTLTKPIRISILSVLVVLAGRTFNASGQTLTVLYSFSGKSDGLQLLAGLVQGNDGNFYGATSVGGTSTNCPFGCGTVFRITPSGTLTNLYSFSDTDGEYPVSALLQGSDGNLYGTTEYGGFDLNPNSGDGTLFRLGTNGVFTYLDFFGGYSHDGKNPLGTPILGRDGYLYGTTYFGGTNDFGTVFSIPSNLPNFFYPPLVRFAKTNGANPSAGLTLGNDGNFYGTTQYGGIGNAGTVFLLTTNGTLTTLVSFANYNCGNPRAGLVQGSDGNFYGTTQFGGAGGSGTVYRVSPAGSFTNLYSFSGSDGRYPNGLVQGSDGNFYGTTQFGGAGGSGTVYRVSPAGSFTNLYSFSGSDGAYPCAGLVQGTNGDFYGTTLYGGTSTNCPNGCGTVFRISVPLNPPPYPINQITGVQLSGTDIILSIPSVAYETYQLQFSSSMNPTNWVNVPVSVTNSIGALLTLTNFGGASQPQGFYRFDITP